MKRLLCIIANMNAGGAETFLMKLYRALDKKNYQMDFCINVMQKCFYEDEILSNGGKVFRIKPKSSGLKEFRENLFNIIKNNDYKYVLRITSNAIGFMDLKIAKKAGAKVCSVRSSNSSDGKGLKVWCAHKLGKILYSKYIDVKFAPSDLAAKYTFGEKAYKNREIAILHNGIDLNIYRYDKMDRRTVREELGINENIRLFGHIGRFMPQKNHDFLINIFKEIAIQNDTAKFILVGCGELESEVKNKVKRLGLEEKVIFAGIRSNISQLLSAMDVFVFPSLYEGMPNTVIEAQATGLPCVVSDTITREADITGLVEYVSLNETAEHWAKISLNQLDRGRKDTKQDFIQNQYDIKSVVKEFVSLVFNEGSR